MPTDEERREVARRLREIDVDSIGHVYELLEEVANCIGCEGVKYGTSYGQFVVLLADLIEPPTQCPLYHSDRHYCSIYEDVHAIDRDALLALADELDMCADGCRRSDRAPLTAEEVWECARRIREACGEGER